FRCKYRECSHDQEPDCGIKKAIEDSEISYERYCSYLGILKNITFREGEAENLDSALTADLKAREQFRDENLSAEKKEEV
ncbi:MAG: hypothetical protein K2X39_04045, partial [Silvanigrellaceae bacterium]|nr:hypothetical protein [Silvanigrellaceae bacterium]